MSTYTCAYMINIYGDGITAGVGLLRGGVKILYHFDRSPAGRKNGLQLQSVVHAAEEIAMELCCASVANPDSHNHDSRPL